MATCKDCVHVEACLESDKDLICRDYKDSSRFVELPCKVGDTVFIIVRISGKEKIIQDSVESLEISFFADNTPIIQFDGVKTCDWDSSDFGKRVFLTKEQAEQALKEKEVKENG